MIYTPQMTLRDARDIYFRLNNFGGDGGYTERWIKVKVWRIPIWLPNTEGRRKAVKLHDLHNILTEYPTTWRGEAEISAWEIGSGGLHRYYAGWLLDLMNVAQGLVVNPLGVYRGFMRGRRSSNLFYTEFNDDMLTAPVSEFRQRLRLDEPPEPVSFKDNTAFLFWILVSAATYIGALFLPLVSFIAFILWVFWW